MDLNLIFTILFGAGSGGAIIGIQNVIKAMRSGKVQSEETLLSRIDADNKKQQEMRLAAEKRADDAEKEAEGYRKQRNGAREEVARLRWFMIQQGLTPPESGDDT